METPGFFKCFMFCRKYKKQELTAMFTAFALIVDLSCAVNLPYYFVSIRFKTITEIS